MSHLKLTVLGTLEIQLDGQPVPLPTRKTAALLAYLGVTGKSHTRDSLSALLWPESDTFHARNSLRGTLWKLSTSGLADWVEADPIWIGIRSGYDLDEAAFQQAASQAFTHNHPPEEACQQCIAWLTQAASLYQGEFLKGFSLKDSLEFDDWQVYQAEGLRQRYSQVLERLVQLLGQAGAWQQALGYARSWTNLDPLHEPAQRALMRLYAQTGKRELALKRFRLLKEMLQEELGVEPDAESRRLYEEILHRRASGQPAQPPGGNGSRFEDVPNHNLPAQLTSFIGREKEISGILPLLSGANNSSSHRLVTLTGPGGSGKTRLGLQIASLLLDSYSGVWFVQIAGLNDPEMVPRAAASALNLHEQPGREAVETMVHFLRARGRTLLVLDNCEHLLSACAHMAALLLEECPQLCILATSIQALGVSGEVIWPVPGLAMPPTAPEPSAMLAQSEAAYLFVERARLVQPRFELTERNSTTVDRICRKLDGLPLAIELAAARTKVFSAEEIDARLENRFQLLKTSSLTIETRHQTLQAVVEWSYNLLDAPEQALFDRLSVFQGGFSLDAAEAVCQADDSAPPVLDLLVSLVEKSMVLADPGASMGTRYHLLANLQQYGQRQLRARGEEPDVQRRHAEYYHRLAEEADPGLRGPDQLDWLERLEVELDNLRAALAWSAWSDPRQGLQLVSALWWFWIIRGYFREGKEWFEQLLDLTDSSRNEIAHIRAYTRYTWLNYFHGDGEKFTRLAEESLRRSRQSGDLESTAAALMMASVSKNYTNEAMAAWPLLEEALSLFRQTENKWGVTYTLRGLSDFANGRLNDYPLAKKYALEALALSRELGDLRGIARSLLILGNIENNLGNWKAAEVYYLDSLSIVRRLKDRIGSAILLSMLGHNAKDQKDYEKAARLQEECLQIHKEINTEDEIAMTVAALAELALIDNQVDRAYELCRESIQIAGDIKRKSISIYPLILLGDIYRQKADFTAAHTSLREALELAREISPVYELVARALEGLARLSLAQDLPERAVKLFGACNALREANHLVRSPHKLEIWERCIQEAKARLDEVSFAGAWAAGKAMAEQGLQPLVEYASGEAV